MKSYVVLFVVVVVCCLPLAVLSQEVISGNKFNAFRASSANYMNMPVVLEDTFENIVEKFSIIEIGNNLTSAMYVKFDLGQSPYPCIGMRTTPVMSGLNQVGPSDLVRVTGSLNTIQEKPKKLRTRGTYTGGFRGGSRFRETTRIYGPKKSEIYFSVSKVEKGWGKGDSFHDMAEEGKSLHEEHYQEVKPGATQLEREQQVEKLVDQAIWFQGTYEGLDDKTDDLEKAAGITPDKVITFLVKVGDKTSPCYIPFSEQNLEGFKSLPVGTELQVYGRIRKKETPQGWVASFVADKVLKIVTPAEPTAPKEAPAPAEKEPKGSAALPAEELPPPPLP